MLVTNAPQFACSPADACSIEALYLHVPFCAHKCHYCDFYSITRQTPERMDRFVDLLLAEADRWLESSADHPPRPRTVFFGGGTPSLLPFHAMDRLLSGLKARLDLSAVEEWTIEVNPATADEAYFKMLRAHGVDRLSFGAQSFDPKDLALLERDHRSGDIEESLRQAQNASFKRLNLDLIFAVPGQTLQSWLASLEKALSFNTSHLSCYGLTYESNTPLTIRKRLGEFQPVEESLELQMLHATRATLLDAGFVPYEISNFARAGQACRHNLIYWTGGNYLGLGPAAASHINGRRWRNRPHLGEWERAIADGRPAVTDVEELTQQQRDGELAMLMLRLGEGLTYDGFAARTGRDARHVFADPIGRMARLGLVSVDGTAVRLTETGLNVADAVAAEFIVTGG